MATTVKSLVNMDTRGNFKMLSFNKTRHNLSGSQIMELPLHNTGLKEGIFRLLLLRGSLSIEAALVLPLFLFFLLTMLSCLQLLNFSLKLQQSIFNEGIYLSETGYDKGNITVGELAEDITDSFSSAGESLPVEGGIGGLNLKKSVLDNPELTKIRVEYTAKLNFDPFDLFSRKFCQQVTFHNWTGYAYGLTEHADTYDEEYVYITDDSEVYHRSRDCTHIRLKIIEADSGDIKTMRNEYGEKYVSCSHCHAKLSDGKLYITAEGNCYHNSLDCSGLTRSVRAIPLSQVGNRRPCSRCGY